MNRHRQSEYFCPRKVAIPSDSDSDESSSEDSTAIDSDIDCQKSKIADRNFKRKIVGNSTSDVSDSSDQDSGSDQDDSDSDTSSSSEHKSISDEKDCVSDSNQSIKSSSSFESARKENKSSKDFKSHTFTVKRKEKLPEMQQPNTKSKYVRKKDKVNAVGGVSKVDSCLVNSKLKAVCEPTGQPGTYNSCAGKGQQQWTGVVINPGRNRSNSTESHSSDVSSITHDGVFDETCGQDDTPYLQYPTSASHPHSGYFNSHEFTPGIASSYQQTQPVPSPRRKHSSLAPWQLISETLYRDLTTSEASLAVPPLPPKHITHLATLPNGHGRSAPVEPCAHSVAVLPLKTLSLAPAPADFIDWACLQSPQAIVGLLDSRRYRVDRGTDHHGNSLMHLACEVGNLSLVSYLLDAYPSHSFSFPNQQGLHPIHIACQSSHFHVVKCLVDKDPSPICLLTTQTATGWTPLHFASAGKAASCTYHSGATQLLRYLVERIPDDLIWQRDCKGMTALHVASAFNSAGAVLALLTSPSVDIFAADGENRRSVDIIAAYGHVNVFTVVMQKSSATTRHDIVKTAGSTGATCLHWAASFQRLDMIRYLLENGADACARDYSGRNPSDMTNSLTCKYLLTMNMRHIDVCIPLYSDAMRIEMSARNQRNDDTFASKGFSGSEK